MILKIQMMILIQQKLQKNQKKSIQTLIYLDNKLFSHKQMRFGNNKMILKNFPLMVSVRSKMHHKKSLTSQSQKLIKKSSLILLLLMRFQKNLKNNRICRIQISLSKNLSLTQIMQCNSLIQTLNLKSNQLKMPNQKPIN